jgi:putative endonuclease
MGKKTGFHEKTSQRQIGNLGEDLACRYLQEHKFKILERNHNQPWGEIDIIARKQGRIHFIEVKSIKKTQRQYDEGTGYDPRENLSAAKITKLIRSCQMYVQQQDSDQMWQLDALIVYIDPVAKVAHIQELPNLSL